MFQLNSPSYVIYSENLLNKTFVNTSESEKRKERTDVFRPFEKSHNRRRSSGRDRFRKMSGTRAKKIKTESHSRESSSSEKTWDGVRTRVKNDNEKKTEQKIKHVSTVSLPNYNELIKPRRKVSADTENGDDKNGNQSVGLKHPRRNTSSISLPGEGSNSLLTSLSEATIHRLEAYMKRCRSFGSMKPQQLLEKLEELNKNRKSASESSDSWSGLDDWDLGIIEYHDSSETQAPPLTPKFTIPSKQGKVTFYTPDSYSDSNENKPPAKVPIAKPRTRNVLEIPKSDIIEGVPLEWFLNPQRRSPAIMPPPPEGSDKTTATPPPSPDRDINVMKENEDNDHSSLLHILRQYKEEEGSGPELNENMFRPIEGSEKTHSSSDIKPVLVPAKPHSRSVTETEILIASPVKYNRSRSVVFEKSNYLLQQLEQNKDEIEEEILTKPNKLLNSLRRESLRCSLPEDAFEAFVCRRKSSLRDSLNRFADGLEKTHVPVEHEVPIKIFDDDMIEDSSREVEMENDRPPSHPPTPPPLPLEQIHITIRSTRTEGSVPIPTSLVTPNDNLGLK